MGRKREKGKARKAKAAAAQLAATQQAPLNAGASAQHAMVGSQGWRLWTMVGLTRGCAHGCPPLPAPDHVVSLFMDDLWANSNAKKSYDCIMVDNFDNHRQVWGDDATLRKLALDIMVAIGTNFITIYVLEHYNGHGKIKLATCQAFLVADDIHCGGEREVVRFFLKRISCTCLKAKYSLIKKFRPIRICECYTCKQLKVRSSMMLCERCRAKQYCCRECQAADWPDHKGLCRVIHKQMKK